MIDSGAYHYHMLDKHIYLSSSAVHLTAADNLINQHTSFPLNKELEANISKDQNCRAQPALCQRDISREIEHS